MKSMKSLRGRGPSGPAAAPLSGDHECIDLSEDQDPTATAKTIASKSTRISSVYKAVKRPRTPGMLAATPASGSVMSVLFLGSKKVANPNPKQITLNLNTHPNRKQNTQS